MSDYMKEAERLIEDFGHCRVAESILIRCGTPREVSCAKEKVESARAALLAHIQRGAAPEGWRDAAPKTQWATCPETGTPCSSCPTNRTQCHALAAPAEVPMPEMGELLDWVSACQSAYHIDSTPGHRFGGLGSNLEYNRAELVSAVQEMLRTYGAACRAAGEAAGYARGLRDAVRDAEIEALRLYVRALCKAVDAATDFIGTVAGGASWWDDVWADHAAALDRARERISQAALRGEVKP